MGRFKTKLEGFRCDGPGCEAEHFGPNEPEGWLVISDIGVTQGGTHLHDLAFHSVECCIGFIESNWLQREAEPEAQQDTEVTQPPAPVAFERVIEDGIEPSSRSPRAFERILSQAVGTPENPATLEIDISRAPG